MAIQFMIAFVAVMLFQGRATELHEENKTLKSENQMLTRELTIDK